MSTTSKSTSRIKAIGNIAGWLISVLSGVFTLFEITVPKGATLSSLGINNDVSFLLSVLNIWYVKYGIAAVFVILLLFFVFPREEERVKKRRRSARAKKKG